VRISDDEVERYLKLFTFMPLPKISELMEAHRQDPSKSMAQHVLAYEFVNLIHGAHEADKAEEEFRKIFNPETLAATDSNKPSPALPSSGFWNPRADPRAPQTNNFTMPSPHVTLPRSLVVGQPFHKIIWSAGMVSSKAEGHRLIANKGASVGSKSGSGTMDDGLSYMPLNIWPGQETDKFIIDDALLILRVGKWKVKIVKIISDEEFEDRGLNAPGWKEADPEPDPAPSLTKKRGKNKLKRQLKRKGGTGMIRQIRSKAAVSP
jgi:tyrosyl-tRNA synthetase